MGKLFEALHMKRNEEKTENTGENCCYCGKRLKPDSFYRQPNGKCCQSCYREKNPDKFCARCGSEGEGGQLYKWDGKKLCSSCYRFITAREMCAFCKKKMEENDRKYVCEIKKYVHLACFERIDKINIQNGTVVVVFKKQGDAQD